MAPRIAIRGSHKKWKMMDGKGLKLSKKEVQDEIAAVEVKDGRQSNKMMGCCESSSTPTSLLVL